MTTSIRKILTLIIASSLFLASCGVDNSATQSSAYKEREDSHEGFEEHTEEQIELQYDGWSDFMLTKEAPYADEETVNFIREAYSEIDFMGVIKKDNAEKEGEHIEAFLKLLHDENALYEVEASDEYYYFDVDEDKYNLPELTVRKASGELYVFKYQPETNQCVLWSKLESCWYFLIGSRKVLWTGNGGQYLSFYQLNVNGEIECQTFFGCKWFNENESFHMIEMPVYAGKSNEENVTEHMKTQGAYVESEDNWCFRVSEEQYDEIADEYWEAYDLAAEEMTEVSYSYDELVEKLSSL